MALSIGPTGDARLFNLLNNTDMLAVSQGLVEGATHDIKYFRNESIDNTGYKLLASDGVDSYPFFELASGVSLDIASDDANDATGGTGARTATVYGLNAAIELQQATVDLNGTTKVALPGTWAAVYRVRAGDIGTYDDSIVGDTNIGQLDVTINVTDTFVCSVPASEGSTFTSIRAVPSGHTMYVNNFNFSAGQNDNISVKVRAKDRMDIVTAPFGATRTIYTFDGRNANILANTNGWIRLPEKTMLFCTAINNSNGNAKVSGSYETLLINNAVYNIP
ncbi:hypothetical protein [uncultured Paraglaciecola sp.]|uniref:hypothetical protein n=1 Tax=uncultured Paraglaciecola sp. TaxID=1765024 RepID=UPI00260A75B2|nr:hypothetical protein [uncultured Paraglaciecola sp.]